MNAVEIEEAVSRLAEQPFDAEGFPYAFLEAFGNKATTIQRLKSGSTNQSDLGGVLQRGNIHIKVCPPGEVGATLQALRESKKTTTQRAKFVLATDGVELQAESLEGEGETLACEYPKFADHFGFFLPLAGISTVRQIRENAFDIKATGRLNRLYVELLKDNPEWATAARRADMNHFMARVIFCFFAEDTNIFHGESLFTATVEQMSARDSSNTHEVISELFRAMNTPLKARDAANIKSWANVFPYVNGGLFSDSVEVPRFSKIARSYLLHVGNLDWTKINPDIFGSMIQAVADDEERGSLGMHYTSVPNILKVLNPLFLDELRARLEEAGDGRSPGSLRKLLNLRNRIARIRVFDPACGSGNFLVIAYKEMREIEAEINRRRGEAERKSDIPKTNFRGIELRSFSCEIARLALIIAEYQCDVLYRGQQLALAEFLPLEKANWITCGNALRLDWLSICPPTGRGVKNRAEDLFETPLDQAEIDFENEGGETYICGNPPYAGKGKKSTAVASDMNHVLNGITESSGYIDLAGCWFVRASQFLMHTRGVAAFVATNSICQGQQLLQLWPLVLSSHLEIRFAHLSFKWTNLASNNAGVTCVVVGVGEKSNLPKRLFEGDSERLASNINAYLLPGKNIYIDRSATPISSDLPEMLTGSVVNDGGNLIVDQPTREALLQEGIQKLFFAKYLSSQDFIQGNVRYVIDIPDDRLDEALIHQEIRDRLNRVQNLRLTSKKRETREMLSGTPHKFQHRAKRQTRWAVVVPRVSSASRAFLPAGTISAGTIVADTVFELLDAPLWSLAVLVSRIHIAWIDAVCGKLKTDYRYSNSLGWNSFPVPPFTEQNKADLTRCAEDILLAREAHFPATIAELYDPAKMPANLRAAHERNDETLERIYLGRRFKNDTERLEKLFELYTKMTANQPAAKKAAKKVARRTKGGGA
jgi:hypothetical protein